MSSTKKFYSLLEVLVQNYYIGSVQVGTELNSIHWYILKYRYSGSCFHL